MRRIRRRLLGAVVGVGLGFWAAGWSSSSAAPGGDAQEASTSTPSAATEAAPVAATSTEVSGQSPAVGHHVSRSVKGRAAKEAGEEEESNEGARAASELVPREQDIRFFHPVLLAVVGLFVAAVVVGIPALKLKSPEPPDPAASDHGHDDHAATDAHGHAAGDSHAKH